MNHIWICHMRSQTPLLNRYFSHQNCTTHIIIIASIGLCASLSGTFSNSSSAARALAMYDVELVFCSGNLH